MKNRLLVCLIVVIGLVMGPSGPSLAAPERPGRPKLALALGGGGVRGASAIGVLRVFEKEQIPVDFIVGSSMGAFVGGLYCAGVPADKIEQVLLDGSARKAFMPGPYFARLFLRSLLLLQPRSWRAGYPGVYNGRKFARFIDSLVPEERRNIENLEIPFAAIVTNLLDGKAYRISQGDLGTAIQASCALPTLHQPVAVNGSLFVDGGIRANMPTYPARATGADIVIALDADDHVKPIERRQLKSLRFYASRIASIVVSELDDRHRQAADLVLEPDVGGIQLLSRRREDILKAISEGEKVATAALPAIRKLLNGSATAHSGTNGAASASAPIYVNTRSR
jgi:NTE family protein